MDSNEYELLCPLFGWIQMHH